MLVGGVRGRNREPHFLQLDFQDYGLPHLVKGFAPLVKAFPLFGVCVSDGSVGGLGGLPLQGNLSKVWKVWSLPKGEFAKVANFEVCKVRSQSLAV